MSGPRDHTHWACAECPHCAYERGVRETEARLRAPLIESVAAAIVEAHERAVDLATEQTEKKYARLVEASCRISKAFGDNPEMYCCRCHSSMALDNWCNVCWKSQNRLPRVVLDNLKALREIEGEK